MNNLSMRRKRRTQPSLPEINLTPLIDTALTLLIIFMVATPMLKQENALQVELPHGKVQEINGEQSQDLIVSIDKTGKLFLNSTEIQEKEILEKVKTAVGKKTDQTIFFKADVKVAYGKVIELVDSLKQIEGVRYVALATSKIT